jgi:hypothetical protein
LPDGKLKNKHTHPCCPMWDSSLLRKMEIRVWSGQMFMQRKFCPVLCGGWRPLDWWKDSQGKGLASLSAGWASVPVASMMLKLLEVGSDRSCAGTNLLRRRHKLWTPSPQKQVAPSCTGNLIAVLIYVNNLHASSNSTWINKCTPVGTRCISSNYLLFFY